MRSTPERVNMAKEAARRRAQKGARMTLGRLRAICAALALGLLGTLAHFAGCAAGEVQGMGGATLLAESAGGYVLVAVVTFIAAAALTLLCTRLRERSRREEENGRKKEEEAR